MKPGVCLPNHLRAFFFLSTLLGALQWTGLAFVQRSEMSYILLFRMDSDQRYIVILFRAALVQHQGIK